MSISVSKGDSVSVAKDDDSIESVTIGLGWDVNESGGAAFDLDASCFMLTETGKVSKDEDFIFYNNLKSSDGSVQHMGDNRVGGSEGEEGDEEQITVNLRKVPNHIKSVAVVVTIHKAEKRKQNFGMVKNAYMRIVDNDTNEEIARFDLAEHAPESTAIVFGDLYRVDDGWNFKADGTGYVSSIGAIATFFGVDVED